MTYSEYWMEEQLTQSEAKKMVADHGAYWDDFTSEVGENSTYTGKEVLFWLGY